LSRDDAQKAASCFKLHLNDGRYKIVPLAQREYALARNWIGTFTTSLRTLDALHLAAAFCNDQRLVTADKALAKAAKCLAVEYKLIA